MAEGWDGKSFRQHIESALAEAGAARDLAESAHDEIATLRAELAEALGGTLAEGGQEDTQRAADDAAVRRAEILGKIALAWAEIAACRLFVLQTEGLSEALAEWRQRGGRT